ncbi:hypothetical protein SAMN05660206_101330 [Sphingobacterium wenxiniae]|uniref:Uncharacterized protein n=2 Tax=Sphingobacterium wenxiniae TaxID=683125 RepID=A0A1I6P8M1_9SPHI|nr:hypothetical protein SAMN05660206_101330 [Sphingobacterium wenxiniae]
MYYKLMIRYCIITILTILTSIVTSYGQNEERNCNCPENIMAGTTEESKPDTTFHFSNGKTIILCGYKNPDSNPITFSEFILSVCEQDTIIDFWGAMLTCRLKVHNDTLFVDDLRNLPTGENLKYQETVWSTEKIYFNEQRIVRQCAVNRQIRKYDQSEINTALREYEMAKFGLDDNKMEIATKLFMATISGDKKARQYFKEFATKFGTLDGAFAEEYKDLTSMLELWDDKK